MSGFFRKNIENMHGYVPGEQPKIKSLIKLNTNENPYPPTPNIEINIKKINCDLLKLYPDPLADKLREELAKSYKLKKDNLIVGNGSDDILTITARSFVGENDVAACFLPSYSLYPILTDIQNSEIIQVPLNIDDFSPPNDLINPHSDLFNYIKKARIFFIARPNAPTGTNVSIDFLEKFCDLFPGIVFIDEAYADFSKDNTLCLLGKFPNIIISRTLSKSYSLAGLRVGWAIASEQIISGMMKVKGREKKVRASDGNLTVTVNIL